MLSDIVSITFAKNAFEEYMRQLCFQIINFFMRRCTKIQTQVMFALYERSKTIFIMNNAENVNFYLTKIYNSHSKSCTLTHKHTHATLLSAHTHATHTTHQIRRDKTSKLAIEKTK